MQLPVNIATLLPAGFARFGQSAPDACLTPASATGQPATFADALRVLLGNSGQPAVPPPGCELIAGVPELWAGEQADDSEPVIAILFDEDSIQSTDATPLMFSMIPSEADPSAPFTTQVVSEEAQEMTIGADGTDPIGKLPPRSMAASASEILTELQTATATDHGYADRVPSESGVTLASAEGGQRQFADPLTSEIAVRPVPRPTVLVPLVQADADHASAMPESGDSNETALPSARVSVSAIAGGSPQSVNTPEADALLRTARAAGDDANLKISITPQRNEVQLSQHAGPAPANESSRPPVTVADITDSTGSPVRDSATRALDSAPAVIVPENQLSVPATEVQSLAKGEPAKVVPSFSHQISKADPNDRASRAVRRVTAGKTAQSSGGRTQISGKIGANPEYAELHADNAPQGETTSAPAKALLKSLAPIAPRTDSSEDAPSPSRPENARPASADQIQSREIQAQGTGNHLTPADRPEQPEPVTPARFQFEIPKPLRVPGQIRVHLDPPELGQVRIDLTAHRDGIVGSLRFQSDQARQVVERELGQLQKTLQDAGVRVERLEVVHSAPSEPRTTTHTGANSHNPWSQNATPQHAHGGLTRGFAGNGRQQSVGHSPAAQPEPVAGAAQVSVMHLGRINLVA